jgi:hypothetical protein
MPNTFAPNRAFYGVNEYNKYDRTREVKEIIIHVCDILIK